MMPALDEPNLELRLKRLGLWLTEAAAEQPSRPAGAAQVPVGLAEAQQQAAAARAD